jgi:hypothetical protein
MFQVSTWFRLENRTHGEFSPVWRNLLKALPLLDHWLCWKTGNGETIQAGRDHIMGMGLNSFLSKELLAALKVQGDYFSLPSSKHYYVSSPKHLLD